tara:strand:- start:117 stop:395 length:279 start_codon:yes stop_codon:yes gene_type:complete
VASLRCSHQGSFLVEVSRIKLLLHSGATQETLKHPQTAAISRLHQRRGTIRVRGRAGVPVPQSLLQHVDVVCLGGNVGSRYPSDSVLRDYIN